MIEDPLDEIWAKPEQVEGEKRALLAKMLKPLASIDPETGKVNLKAKADQLNAKQKIAVFLLARLALSTRPENKFVAQVSPKEIEIGLTNLPGGTIRPALAQLLKEHIVTKKGDTYMVPSDNLSSAHKLLNRFISEE